MRWTRRLAARPDATLLSERDLAENGSLENGSPENGRLSPEAPHAVVVGAGLGGLASAIRLGARGFRVTVLERLGQPGGRARVFEQDGFTFDAGPTVVTAPFLFEELWNLCGKELADDVELREVSPFYRIRFDDGSSFDYTGDPEAMRREVARFSPEDVAGYEQFFEKSKEIFEVGFEELGHVPFSRLRDMLKIVPAMAALGSHRSVYGLVSKYIDDPKLRKVFSFHPLLVGGNPFSVTSIYALIAFLERKWRVWYAMGGTGALVKGMADLVTEELGGTIRTGAEVEEILLADAPQSQAVGDARATGVRLTGGERVGADLVVSNADVGFTYKHLLPEAARTRWTDERVDGLRQSMSLFVWYFGTDRTYDDVAHHTILMGPRYEALLNDIFHEKTLADDFSLYLHRPTRTDPSMAPGGHDAFYVLSPVPHLESGIDWRTEAEPYRRKVSRYLSETVLPELEAHLVTSRMLTPQDFRDDYLSLKGAAFGPEPVLTQSAYFRPHNASEDVEHLYFAGAGTHPGAGIPGVLSTARVLDTVVPEPATFRTEKSPS